MLRRLVIFDYGGLAGEWVGGRDEGVNRKRRERARCGGRANAEAPFFLKTIVRSLLFRWSNERVLAQIFRNNVSDGKSARRIPGFAVDRLCFGFEWEQSRRRAIGLRHHRRGNPDAGARGLCNQVFEKFPTPHRSHTHAELMEAYCCYCRRNCA